MLTFATLFSYHAPTDETAPLHEAIGKAKQEFLDLLGDIGARRVVTYDLVNEAALVMLEAAGFRRDDDLLDADLTFSLPHAGGAVVELALARNLANHVLSKAPKMPDDVDRHDFSDRALREAAIHVINAAFLLNGLVAVVGAVQAAGVARGKVPSPDEDLLDLAARSSS